MRHPTDRTSESRLIRAGLPTSHDIHWSLSRKEDVVRAVRDKLISFDEARWRYLLSRREFESWERSVDRGKKERRTLEVS
ncbi:DUF1153 domain-containing protein [Leptolyngbya sp. 15MV]|nr:DUF1153 domain-containing protein [Leptolyngbya sp. 15MV]